MLGKQDPTGALTPPPLPQPQVEERKWLHCSFAVVISITFIAYILPLILSKGESSILRSNPASISTHQLFMMLFSAPIITWGTLLPVAISVTPQLSLAKKFALDNRHLLDLPIAVATGTLFYIVCGIVNLISQSILTALHIKLPDPIVPRLAIHCNTTNFILLSIAIVIIAPITEEVVFRRIIFSWLKQYLPTRQAVLLTSAMFAAIHDTLAMFATLFLLAIGLQLLYIRRRSLIPSIIMHAWFNSISLVLLLLIRMSVIPYRLN